MTFTTPKIELLACRLLFPIIMGLLWPLRLLGLFGTSSRPRYFEARSAIPFWLELYAPARHVAMTFGPETKVWFDYRTGCMMAKAMEPSDSCILLETMPAGLTVKGIHIIGAPTRWEAFDGERRAVEDVIEQPALARR